ncbi:MAG: ribosome maturation factor RimP [Acidimicrobiales bacterium]|jgi:ribosome maturation factor RimP|nr:ribosome maturation factor RimP [Acidimicrobiales bacterium]
MPDVTSTVRAVVEPILDGLGLELFDLELRGGTLRLTVEKPGGVDLDDLSIATRSVSRALDAADPIPGRYTLEVSSPGLERPLRTPAHFAWARGRDVVVKTTPGEDGVRRIAGVVLDVDDDGVRIAPNDGGSEVALRYDEIQRARTVFAWGPAPKPGAKEAR